jgi:hypothetical protein
LGGCLWAPSGGPACPQAPCSTARSRPLPPFLPLDVSLCHGDVTLPPVTALPFPRRCPRIGVPHTTGGDTATLGRLGGPSS